jgi:hypothetical protein
MRPGNKGPLASDRLGPTSTAGGGAEFVWLYFPKRIVIARPQTEPRSHLPYDSDERYPARRRRSLSLAKARSWFSVPMSDCNSGPPEHIDMKQNRPPELLREPVCRSARTRALTIAVASPRGLAGCQRTMLQRTVVFERRRYAMKPTRQNQGSSLPM